jgi:hypothetical protein
MGMGMGMGMGMRQLCTGEPASRGQGERNINQDAQVDEDDGYFDERESGPSITKL